jgi:hypothetical protein
MDADRTDESAGPPAGSELSRPALRRLLIGYRVAAVGLGAVAAWRHRFVLNPDGVSYLDLGDAMAADGPAAGLNSYWSPLYPLVLALVRALSGFTASLELPMAHLANLLIFLGAVAAFELLLGELVAVVEAADAGSGLDREGAVSPAAIALVGLGYPLFLLAMLRLIGLGFVTPDSMVATLAVTAVALLLRLARGGGGAGLGATLGLALGLGYLAKTPMLFIGLAILACGWAAARDRRARWGMVAATLVAAVIAGGFIGALSARYGRLAWGDNGRINYAFHVNGVPHFSHTKADQGVYGTLLHPLRQVHRDPPVYAFAEPIAGTYPPWYDPGYWYEGVRPRFDVAQQAATLRRSLARLGEIARSVKWGLASLGVVVAAALLTGRRPTWRRLRQAAGRSAVVLAVGVAPLLMYSLVLVRPRYVGGFVLLTVLGVLATALGASRPPAWLGALSVAVGCLLTVTVASDVAFRPIEGEGARSLRIAEALHRVGVGPGAQIGLIGNAYVADWARLGRLRIVADIPKKNTAHFWSADEAAQRRALDAFRRVGVRAVVATSQAPLPRPWRRLGGTAHWVVLFDPEPSDGSDRDRDPPADR